MSKEIIEGVVDYDKNLYIWSFKSDKETFNGKVCEAIDQILHREAEAGEKFRITIENIEI